MTKGDWVFVDDSLEEARSFAGRLGSGPQAIKVVVMSPEEARREILGQRLVPVGVLMDVDLSSSSGELGTGPGIAQDIRVKQRARKIPEFPIVRFAGSARVAENIGDDPTSDDLFDLRIQKEELSQSLVAVQHGLLGLEEVYEVLSAADPMNSEAISKVLGLSQDLLLSWSHSGFHDRLASGRRTALHVAACGFMRGFLMPTGLLVDEQTLAVRLGVDAAASGDAWKALLSKIVAAKYVGAGHEFFVRWWAAGVEDWWFEQFGAASNLAGISIDGRVESLRKLDDLQDLVALQMPTISLGQRPWRLCALSLESNPPERVPVDPGQAVAVTPTIDLPAWVDPWCASLGRALERRDDLRLDRADISRLAIMYRKARK
ncbi:MAG: Uncharacterized protein JWM10_2825 [Myxococcaceae bacterium]|nr:Uncharacterized protein [Myxococcaceae bacterium]